MQLSGAQPIWAYKTLDNNNQDGHMTVVQFHRLKKNISEHLVYMAEMSCYDGYSALFFSSQTSPINLAKRKISILKSQLNISASDNQNKSGFFNWIFSNKQFLKSLHKGQWNTKWNSSWTTPRSQKTHKSTEQNFMAIHPVVEIFQSGPKWWTDWKTGIAIHTV